MIDDKTVTNNQIIFATNKPLVNYASNLYLADDVNKWTKRGSVYRIPN